MTDATQSPESVQPSESTPESKSGPDEVRRQRGLAIAALCKITLKNGYYWVPSQTGSGAYKVDLKPLPPMPKCTCPDYTERRKACKHVYAVEYYLSREKHPDKPEPVKRTVTIKETTAPRPTYRQNWPAYNAAQVNEKAKFQTLLADLCRGIEEPSRPPKRGGQPFKLADVTFAAVFKVYSTVSGRRFSCDLSDAHERGYLSRLPHYNTVFSYFENPALTPILQSLIAESARPLKAVEVDFAVDSSGFSTSRFIRWIDHKYGQPKQQYDWVKCSLMTGVKTNVVTAVEIDERYANDCPKFIPLLNETLSRGFKLREVSADAAYSTYDNLDAVEKVGATPFIAFRAVANPSRPGAYEKMFHYFSLRRDEFLAHYHKRSNVETTFSMIKAKFGDHLRSKTDTAMVNESLAKVLCHNVCCLISAHYELGIASDFWGVDAITQSESTASEVAAAPALDELIDALAWI